MVSGLDCWSGLSLLLVVLVALLRSGVVVWLAGLCVDVGGGWLGWFLLWVRRFVSGCAIFCFWWVVAAACLWSLYLGLLLAWVYCELFVCAVTRTLHGWLWIADLAGLVVTDFVVYDWVCYVVV